MKLANPHNIRLKLIRGFLQMIHTFPACHKMHTCWMAAGWIVLVHLCLPLRTHAAETLRTAETLPGDASPGVDVPAGADEARVPVYAPVRPDPESQASWLANRPEPEPTVQNQGSGGRTVGWLVGMVVIAVFAFWGGLYFLKRWLPGGQHLFASPAMEIVGRTHLDPRRYVAMLRVGRRILLLAVSPDEIRSLGEVEDGTEVADLLAQAKPRSAVGRSVFHSLFQRQAARVDAIQEEAVAEGAAEQLDGTLGSLRERVRSLHAGDGDA